MRNILLGNNIYIILYYYVNYVIIRVDFVVHKHTLDIFKQINKKVHVQFGINILYTYISLLEINSSQRYRIYTK